MHWVIGVGCGSSISCRKRILPINSFRWVVGNVDTKVTKFHASVKLQPAKQELITGFIEQFSERLLEYLDVNGTAPKNIIVYRDGVSEGQFMQVLEEELPALRRACKSFATNCRR
ncbi:putative protein tag-76 [Trichinella spiralis]|uniref:putative protein tag-76 n=1 Tax=Trichinella spiralis TaxID=6334 RepID=UPI0001EFEC03|nr:putative protein tag-76 [Trichinella spiralis]